MKNTKLKPCIYVACLSSYNNGLLHGRWIDAYKGVEYLQSEIANLLAESPEHLAEEYAIYDSDNFEGICIFAFESLASIAEKAAFVLKYGKLGARVADHYGDDIKWAAEALEERYLGCWKSLAAYARDVVENSYQIPEAVLDYIDFVEMGSDMEKNDISAIPDEEGLWHLFSDC